MSPITLPLKQQTAHPELVAEFDDAFSADELKVLYRKIFGPGGPTKKLKLTHAIANWFCTNAEIIFQSLSEIEQKAVSEALHCSHSVSAISFEAKYQNLPAFGSNSYKSSPEPIRLFLSKTGNGFSLRTPLRKFLSEFVPKPSKIAPVVTKSIPEFLDEKITTSRRGPETGVQIVSTENIPIKIVERESSAQKELNSILKLIGNSKIHVAEKSCQPNMSSITISSQAVGDYYDDYDNIGAIRPFAWVMLAQAAGLAQRRGTKLILTQAGSATISIDQSVAIKSIWENWLKTTILDEFQRINVIKGQTGKGKAYFSDPRRRREAIVRALKELPAGEWIKFDDFSTYMRAVDNVFGVTSNPWSLYISDPEYGSLGYSGSCGWNILQERYMRSFLFEYASTLGLIDVAFVEPFDGENDYGQMWGTDDLFFLSRYDGLLYFRVNELGSYCLEKKKTYSSAESTPASLTVLPNLHIKLNSGKLSLEESIVLDSFAIPISPTEWKISQEKAFTACETGRVVDDLRNLLTKYEDQELPQQVQGLLAKVSKQSNAVKKLKTAVIFSCRDEETAKEIASHVVLAKLCQLTNKNQLVVASSDELEFVETLHIVGYGLMCH